MSRPQRTALDPQVELAETYRSITLLTTELCQANDQLRASNQKLSDLYSTALRFVDNVSHEFRTPLSVIKEFAAILHEGIAGALNEQQREYAGIILARVDDLTMMVGDLLDISKLESGLLGIHRRAHNYSDIVEPIRTTLERRAAAGGIFLEFESPPNLPTVYCDAKKAGRVIINLAINACKFCSPGSKVTVWARYDAGCSEVVVGISDTGPGIAPENVEAIFERFRQLDNDTETDTRGFGLGLNIASELVQLNLGDICVESEPGKGSTFTFTMPIHDPILIVERFAQRIPTLRAGSEHVSILTVTTDESAGVSASDELQRLFELRMRRSDIAFRPRLHQWLVCVATSRPQVHEIVERISRAPGESLHFELSEAPPKLEVAVSGTWKLPEHSTAFASAFAAQWHATTSGRPVLLSSYQPQRTTHGDARSEYA